MDWNQLGLAERHAGTVLEQEPVAARQLPVNGRVTVYIGLRSRPT